MAHIEAVPHMRNDAAPPVGDETKIVFLAGAIKFWWLAICNGCEKLAEPKDLQPCPNCGVQSYDKMWGSFAHTRYIEWRDEVRKILIEEGFLTYAPHEAFKGTWTDKAQAINDAGIQMADLMLVLSPSGIETQGTDDEVEVAKRYGTPVGYATPWSIDRNMLIEYVRTLIYG